MSPHWSDLLNLRPSNPRGKNSFGLKCHLEPGRFTTLIDTVCQPGCSVIQHRPDTDTLESYWIIALEEAAQIAKKRKRNLD